jgi:hypothetical protein
MNGIQLTNYDVAISVKKDADGKIAEGMVIGDTLYQNEAIILQIHPGELKENPSIGCGIEDMLLDNDPIAWRRKIRQQMEADGQIVGEVKITTTGINIDAHYKNR